MSTLFDLEQQILQCWNIVDELDLVLDRFPDDTLIAIKVLYQAKFEKCFKTLEEVVAK